MRELSPLEIGLLELGKSKFGFLKGSLKSGFHARAWKKEKNVQDSFKIRSRFIEISFVDFIGGDPYKIENLMFLIVVLELISFLNMSWD
ncbi:hypothetical protein H5410_050173 [Solanum commersonii]|uniref:Uncharacterized protein n=1 Tax=Solanum commersonii TaxID=4109 RepID=A0A9J5WUT3_SOLCO|nr:hypothetical protein H5410_050173 [Solanum commersonii]